jgi:hypothetical protein
MGSAPHYVDRGVAVVGHSSITSIHFELNVLAFTMNDGLRHVQERKPQNSRTDQARVYKPPFSACVKKAHLPFTYLPKRVGRFCRAPWFGQLTLLPCHASPCFRPLLGFLVAPPPDACGSLLSAYPPILVLFIAPTTCQQHRQSFAPCDGADTMFDIFAKLLSCVIASPDMH